MLGQAHQRGQSAGGPAESAQSTPSRRRHDSVRRARDPIRSHPAWVTTKLERLDALLRKDPQRAKVEILKHLDGDLVIVPRPSTTGERRAEISGRAKSDSLLRDQEAVCLQVVAGARNHRYQRSLASRSI